jgi:Protein of unknown function DUF115
MRGIISSRLSPGSQTCIVVGPFEGVADLDLGSYRSVLWFAPGAEPLWSDLLGAGLERVIIEPVERLDAGRTLWVIDDLIRRDPLHMPSVYVTEGVGGASSRFFLPVVDAILAQFESHRGARFFRQQQGFIMQSNVLANLPAYVQRRMPNSWAGALDGIPAFICGAGPSLDTSAAKLAEFARHGVIFATDSAISAMDKLGIQADFAITVDPQKTPADYLAPGWRKPDRLMVASSSIPVWEQAVAKDRIFFLSGRQLTEDWLAENGIPKTATGVTEDCGTTAFELALYLGCHPLCLFGMDHAVDSQDTTRWHHQHFSSELQQHPAILNLPKVPGNFQDEIATPFFREWHMLNARFAELPAGLVLNVIDRGARFRNATLVWPSDFSVGDHSETKTARLARLTRADSIPEPDGRQLFDGIRRVAAVAMPTIAGALEALQQGQRDRVAKLLVQAYAQKPFRQLMGNSCLKIIPYLLRAEAVDDDQWNQFITETGELLRLAASLH